MAWVEVDESRCTACGRCVLVCPVDVFRNREAGGKAFAAYAGDCDGCRICTDECPAACIAIDDSDKAPGTVSIYDALGIEDPRPPSKSS